MAFLQLEMILPDRAYAFFSHTHKAQKENMPLLDKVLSNFHVWNAILNLWLKYCDLWSLIFFPLLQILEERVSLYDYELIVGDHGKRLLAFGKFAGRAGMVDFLRGLGQRMLCYKFFILFYFVSEFSVYVMKELKKISKWFRPSSKLANWINY